MMMALKEKEGGEAIIALDEAMNAQWEAIKKKYEERKTAVEGSGPFAFAAVLKTNEADGDNFLKQCDLDRRKLVNTTAWRFRDLLAVQQQLLSKAGLPGFDGVSVDASTIEVQSKVCGFMHSAFYLRAKIGAGPHLTMLRSQEGRLSSLPKVLAASSSTATALPSATKKSTASHTNLTAAPVSAAYPRPLATTYHPPAVTYPPGHMPSLHQVPYPQHTYVHQQHQPPPQYLGTHQQGAPILQAYSVPPLMVPMQGHHPSHIPPMMAHPPPLQHLRQVQTHPQPYQQQMHQQQMHQQQMHQQQPRFR